MAKVISKGICSFCKSEFAKNTITQHLKRCKQRIAAITDGVEDSIEAEEGKLFHILIEGEYNPQYWMHIEVSASATLADLDSFLRDIWLECCGHLSAFRIGTIDYSSEPESFSFFEDVPKAETAEIAANLENSANEVEAIMVTLPSNFSDHLPPDMLAEMKKFESIDDLLVYLRKEVDSFTSLARLSDVQEQRNRFLLWTILRQFIEQLEDRGMDTLLGRVLKVGQKFSYEYDFGSTTELKLRVISEREGVLAQGEDDDGSITVLARNVPHAIACCVCGKPAKKVAPGYYSADDEGYCSNKCAKKQGGDYDYDEMLPVVNSPRVGVCAYTG